MGRRAPFASQASAQQPSPKPPQEQRIGIVDMGSGTARLVVYAFEPGQWFRLTDEVREPVRLGEGFAAKGKLAAPAIKRALDALQLYGDFAKATGLGKLTVIATSAVREAANQDDFLNHIKGANLEFRVLSGSEEAEYGALAVANGFSHAQAWVMDLGGGSAQLSRLEGRLFAGGEAFPLGAVRLTEQFLKHDPPKPKEVVALERHVLACMGPWLDRVARDDAPLVAMGGTVRNLARAVQRKRDHPLDLLHGYHLSLEDLEGLVAGLLKLKAGARSAVPGLHPDRSDVILAGALVYRSVLRAVCVGGRRKGLLISGQGVREGAFYKHFLPAPHLLPDVRSFSVANLFGQYAQPLAHTNQVRFLARRLFFGLAKLHPFGMPEARLLDEAAWLHDIGMQVNYFDHHKHSAYLVLAAPLPGFTPREQVLLALLTQYHRKGEPKLGAFAPVLEAGDAQRLLVLATCLRLAEYLERSRASRVQDVLVEYGRRGVRLRLVVNGEARAELWEAQKQAALFLRAFGKPLVLDLKLA